MKLALSATGVLAVAGLAAVGLVVWKGQGLASAAAGKVADAVQAVNPFNPDNVVAAVANKVVNLGNTDPAQETNIGGALWEVDNWLREHNPFTSTGTPP
jgi:hypothetical protein